MKREIKVLIAIIFISTCLLGCEKVEKLEQEEDVLIIKYLRYGDSGKYITFPYLEVLDVYNERTGNKVKVEYIDCDNKSEAVKIISTRGQSDELGDLMYLELDEYTDELKIDELVYQLMDMGVTSDLREDIENHENLLPIYGKTNYIPVSMLCKLLPIHKDVVEKFNITKDIFIDNAKSLESMKKIISDRNIELTKAFFKKEINYESIDYYELKEDEVFFKEKEFESYLKDICRRLKGKEYRTEIFEEDYKYIKTNYIGSSRKSEEIERKSDFEFKYEEKIDSPFRETSLVGLILSKQWIIRYSADKYDYMDGLMNLKMYEIDEVDFKLNKEENIGSRGFVVLKKSKKKDESAEFLNFLLSKDGQAYLTSEGKYAPVIKNIDKMIDKVVELLNEKITNPGEKIELSEKQRKKILEIYKDLNSEEFVKELIKAENIKEFTIKSMVEEEFEDIVLRSLFDKDYKEYEREKDIKAAIRKVNLKIKEIL